MKYQSMLIDKGSREQLIASGYKRSILRTILFHLVAILCLGLPYVLVYWHDVFGIQWQYIQCSISLAEVLILEVNEFLLSYFDFYY